MTQTVSARLTAALPDLAGEIHGEMWDAPPRRARVLVDLLHGRLRAPVTDRCPVICLGLSPDTLTRLTGAYGTALLIGDLMKMRACRQLELTDSLSSPHIHEIEFLMEAHRLIGTRGTALTLVTATHGKEEHQ